MAWVHRCLIVPAALRDTCAALCEQLAGQGGSGMFTTPLAPVGQTEATHYISVGLIEDTFAYLLDNPEALAQACQQAGLPVTLAELQAILAACDVSEDQPEAAMARMGLVML